jgi:hypothetical protein
LNGIHSYPVSFTRHFQIGATEILAQVSSNTSAGIYHMTQERIKN